MTVMEMSQLMIEDDRTETFRQFQADQLQLQTKHLDTIKTLMIAWFALAVVGIMLLMILVVAS